jgi:hypothetical protein
MNPITSRLARLFTATDIETGEVRASVEKLVAGLLAVLPGLIALLSTTGLIGPDQSVAVSQNLSTILAHSAEPLTLLVVGILWWRKRDKHDQLVKADVVEVVSKP